jgi:hypothetical protein
MYIAANTVIIRMAIAIKIILIHPFELSAAVDTRGTCICGVVGTVVDTDFGVIVVVSGGSAVGVGVASVCMYVPIICVG